MTVPKTGLAPAIGTCLLRPGLPQGMEIRHLPVVGCNSPIGMGDQKYWPLHRNARGGDRAGDRMPWGWCATKRRTP